MNYCSLLSSDESALSQLHQALYKSEDVSAQESNGKGHRARQERNEPAELRAKDKYWLQAMKAFILTSFAPPSCTDVNLHRCDEPAPVSVCTQEWLRQVSVCSCCGCTEGRQCRYLGAQTLLSLQERAGNSIVSLQSENVLDSCKCCHTLSECLRSNFLPVPNLYPPH